MHLTIRLFAHLREAAAAEAVAVDVADGATVADVRAAAARAVPALAPYVARPEEGVRVAASLRFVDDDHVIGPAEDVAFIPPVGGG